MMLPHIRTFGAVRRLVLFKCRLEAGMLASLGFLSAQCSSLALLSCDLQQTRASDICGFLNGCEALREFCFDSRCTDAALLNAFAAKLSGLSACRLTVTMSQLRVNRRVAAAYSRMLANATVLNVYRCGFQDAEPTDLLFFAGCRQLRVLHMLESRMPDALIKSFHHQLTGLNIRELEYVMDRRTRACLRLDHLPHLQRLVLKPAPASAESHGCRLTLRAWTHLQQLSVTLTSVTLTRPVLDSQGMSVLASMVRRLTNLEVCLQIHLACTCCLRYCHSLDLTPCKTKQSLSAYPRGTASLLFYSTERTNGPVHQGTI
jgi:hypothetical protein